MDSDSLKTELNELHQELARELAEPGTLDPETLNSLKRVAGDIERLIQRQQRSETIEDSEVDTHSLEAMAVAFEVEHPHLAAVLNRVNYLLGNMGI